MMEGADASARVWGTALTPEPGSIGLPQASPPELSSHGRRRKQCVWLGEINGRGLGASVWGVEKLITIPSPYVIMGRKKHERQH